PARRPGDAARSRAPRRHATRPDRCPGGLARVDAAGGPAARRRGGPRRHRRAAPAGLGARAHGDAALVRCRRGAGCRARGQGRGGGAAHLRGRGPDPQGPRRAAHARAVGAEADARHLRLRPRDRRVRRGRGVTSPQLLEGEVSARGRRIAIIAARFNDFIVTSLLKGALGAWVERGGAVSELAVVRVPGAFELPVAARRLAASGRYDALQALYRWQLNACPWQDLVQEFGDAEDMARADRDYFRALIEGVAGALDALDARLAALADRRPDRLDPIEHAILLIGVYELAARPEVPYRVAISEAVGLARRFGATDGHKFVNAVLDRAARELRPPAH